jgi:cyclopropane-fatty-acyl-phospholipid synthase
MTHAVLRPPGASAAAIQRHYDLSNEFYSLWLDESLTYSCALWDVGDDLHAAQLRKIDWHLGHAGDIAGGRILDIGCGWGSTLRRAIEHFDVSKATGLSLSAAQVSFIDRLGMPQMEAHLRGWADYHSREPYDAIISIGAFEHFARLDQTAAEKVAGYRDVFACCRSLLRPGGKLCLQTITYENADRREFSHFFAEQIFPESDLPHLAEIAAAARGLFEIETLRNDRHHYARTAREWLMRLRNRNDEACALVGDDAVQTYRKYLGLLAVGFHTGSMNLARIVMRRFDGPASRARR